MSGPWEDYASSDGPWNDYAPQKPQYQNNEVLADGSRVPVGSPEAQAARSPVAGNNFLQNATLGVGSLYTGALLGMKQMYAQATGGDPNAQTDMAGDTAAERRTIDAPVNSTWGGKVGQVAGAVPLAFVPGANSYAGAAVIGGALGATQPTVGNESRLLNTGVGAGLGVGGKYAGGTFSSWLTKRAAEPFMGWNPSTANRAAASAVGSDADSLTQPVVGEANARIGGIFNQARSPNVSATLGNPTMSAIDAAGNSLNRSTRTAFEGNDNVNDLLHFAANNQPATAEQLGQISSKLAQDARAQMTSKDGDRALGRALFNLQGHVDDMVGSTITDPNLAYAYSTARGQYRSLMQLTTNPTILNSASGDVNMTALGKYLQRTDKPGYLRGGNTSDLYNAARWGQITGEGKGAPALELGNFGVPWLKYQATNNRAVNALGGVTSRLGAPVAPQVGTGLQGLAFGSVPIALPYLEE